MNRAQRIVTALNIAGPLCLKLRYDHYPNCCVEASVAGAEALRRWGLRAHPVRCMMTVSDGERQWWVGATRQEAYALMVKFGSGEPITMEEYFKKCENWSDSDDKNDPLHVVIDVEGSWLLDLTTAQTGPTDMPPSARVQILEGWPVYAEGRKLRLMWAKTDRGDGIHEFDAYKNEGLVLDMMDAMRVSLATDLDVDRFAKRLIRR